MVQDGEVDHLVPERAWQELARGLMEPRPSLMFETLRACGALARILPEVDALFGVPQPPAHHPEIDTGLHIMLVIDYAASRNFALPVRFAALTHDLGKGTTPREQWPAPHRARGARRRAHPRAVRAPARAQRLPRSGVAGRTLSRRDPPRGRAAAGDHREAVRAQRRLRRPERFEELLLSAACDFHGASRLRVAGLRACIAVAPRPAGGPRGRCRQHRAPHRRTREDRGCRARGARAGRQARARG